MRTDDISVRIFFRVVRPDNYRDPTPVEILHGMRFLDNGGQTTSLSLEESKNVTLSGAGTLTGWRVVNLTASERPVSVTKDKKIYGTRI